MELNVYVSKHLHHTQYSHTLAHVTIYYLPFMQQFKEKQNNDKFERVLQTRFNCLLFFAFSLRVQCDGIQFCVNSHREQLTIC